MTFKQKIEQSTSTSHSFDQEANSQQRSKLLQGKSVKIDEIIFPLYDIMTKSIHLPNIIGNIMVIYVALQTLMVTYWDAVLSPINFSTTFCQFFRYFMMVVCNGIHKILMLKLELL